MVFFTCQHCGEALRKAAVEKHYKFKCRNYPSLTCVDCLKDYKGDEYKKHNECMTELERYSAKGFTLKPSSCKQKMKQLKWVDMVQEVLNTPNLNPSNRTILEILSQHTNIPMKRVKFQNFVRNLTHSRSNLYTIDAVFDLLQTQYNQNLEQTKNSSSEPFKESTEQNESVCKTNGNENYEVQEKENCSEPKLEENNKHQQENEDIVLTKKEKKKKHKKEKYLAELNSLQFKDEEQDAVEETKRDKRKKKHKKNVDGDVDMVSDKGVEVKEDKAHLKKKRKKHNEVENDDADVEVTRKKLKKSQLQEDPSIEETQENLFCEELKTKQKKNFSWSETIIKVLETQKDKELPVKKLRKKVIAEYQDQNQEGHKTLEELLAKFNKKVYKTLGVRVLKDRAKLIS